MTRSRDISDVQKNLGGAVAPYVAGKNAVINGGFDIWQRGTSFTSNGTTIFGPDRWKCYSGASATWTQETTNIPAGSRYALKVTAGTSTAPNMLQIIETANVTPLAGQTITISIYMQASASTSVTGDIKYSTTVDDTNIAGFTYIVGQAFTVGTSMQRYTYTATIPANAKTLFFEYYLPSNIATNAWVIFGNSQLELGSIATPFSRAGGSIGRELALCQRYYWRQTATGNYTGYGWGGASSTTNAYIFMRPPVTMRVQPTSVDYSSNLCLYSSAGFSSISALGLDAGGLDLISVFTTSTGLVADRWYRFISNNNSSTYIGLSAEL